MVVVKIRHGMGPLTHGTPVVSFPVSVPRRLPPSPSHPLMCLLPRVGVPSTTTFPLLDTNVSCTSRVQGPGSSHSQVF